jgi:large subunit ribosomal protein L23
MQCTQVLGARFGAKTGRKYRLWMPQYYLMMVSARNATETRPAFAIFRTDPRMTKWEIKEHLVKIYNLPVKKVNTMNYEGKRKRITSEHGIAYMKYVDFKKAVVTFDETLKDVGIGMRVPELDDEDNDEDDDSTMNFDDDSDDKPKEGQPKHIQA